MQRHRRQARARCGKTDAIRVGADRAGAIYEVHRIDAVTAAAFGVVNNVVEDGQAAEIIVFTDFIRRISQLRDVETSQRVGVPTLCSLSGFFDGVRIWAPAATITPAGCGLPPLPADCRRCLRHRPVNYTGRIVQDGCAAIIPAVHVGRC